MHRSSVASSAEQFSHENAVKSIAGRRTRRRERDPREEIAEALGVGISVNAALVYTARMLDAFDKTV
jgi:hypothetical protein